VLGGADEQTNSIGHINGAGTVVPDMRPADEAALQRFEESRATGATTLLGIRGERAFYRIGTSSGPTCYAVGPREVGEYRFGQITCAGDFPSAEKPILDFSIVHIDLSGRAGITRAEGIAADGISEVAFRSPAGSLVGAMRVRDNIYSGPAIAAAVSGIVAVDRSGRVAYETSVGRAAPAGGTLP
jgi:hypothetical protein